MYDAPSSNYFIYLVLAGCFNLYSKVGILVYGIWNFTLIHQGIYTNESALDVAEITDAILPMFRT